MFTSRLTFGEVVSIVVAAPSGTALHHSMSGGWVITDHLLATMAEQDAGLVQLQERLPRPGVTETRVPRPSTPTRINDKDNTTVTFDVMNLDDYRARKGT